MSKKNESKLPIARRMREISSNSDGFLLQTINRTSLKSILQNHITDSNRFARDGRQSNVNNGSISSPNRSSPSSSHSPSSLVSNRSKSRTNGEKQKEIVKKREETAKVDDHLNENRKEIPSTPKITISRVESLNRNSSPSKISSPPSNNNRDYKPSTPPSASSSPTNDASQIIASSSKSRSSPSPSLHKISETSPRNAIKPINSPSSIIKTNRSPQHIAKTSIPSPSSISSPSSHYSIDLSNSSSNREKNKRVAAISNPISSPSSSKPLNTPSNLSSTGILESNEKNAKSKLVTTNKISQITSSSSPSSPTAIYVASSRGIGRINLGHGDRSRDNRPPPYVSPQPPKIPKSIPLSSSSKSLQIDSSARAAEEDNDSIVSGKKLEPIQSDEKITTKSTTKKTLSPIKLNSSTPPLKKSNGSRNLTPLSPIKSSIKSPKKEIPPKISTKKVKFTSPALTLNPNSMNVSPRESSPQKEPLESTVVAVELSPLLIKMEEVNKVEIAKPIEEPKLIEESPHVEESFAKEKEEEVKTLQTKVVNEEKEDKKINEPEPKVVKNTVESPILKRYGNFLKTLNSKIGGLPLDTGEQEFTPEELEKKKLFKPTLDRPKPPKGRRLPTKR
eukprot:TRINITY_DN3808_c0_g1_i1.p1 TRINITY_DN3808_c0_g1~~TRINITY_DN3808_c0_g1_i1.p1  ORF type:complete len:619 (-),score=226.96 TRINITY_DN3808_c0_g1_i1:133-1989(-)